MGSAEGLIWYYVMVALGLGDPGRGMGGNLQ